MKLDSFINRPVLSTVISIVIVILGVLGLNMLPIEQYPSIAPPTIAVRTSYPGANAQTVLNSVIAPLEEQINGVEGMTYMTSTASNTGSASINVYFKEDVDPNMAAINVQNRVAQAQNLLPAEVTRVGVNTEKRQSSTLLSFAVTSKNGRYDSEFLANYADVNIIPSLKRIQGVGSAEALSAKTFSMRIWLEPEKMRLHNLVPTDINTALSGQNIEAAPGSFGQSGDRSYEYVLRYKGRLQTAEEYGDIIINADNNGNIIRLKDVAKVELGSLSYSSISNINGNPSTMVSVSQIAGSNANDIIKEVKRTVEELKVTFPPDLEIRYVVDVSDFLYASIWEVIKTLIEAFILVFIVVYVFLQDFRSTLIPAIAVPVSLIGTFFFLYLFGFSINLLTLSALVLAIAIVVDDAIVVVEAVHAKLDKGYKSARLASIDAMNEISGAIISITLVMAAVFIPVSFISGLSGTFYNEFGITMAIAIIISAINALTLSPALCAVFLKPHSDENGKKATFIDRFHIAFNTQYDRLLGVYKNSIRYFLKHKYIVAGIVIASIATLLILMNITSSSLVPDEDTGTVFAIVAAPPGTSLEKTGAIVQELGKSLQNQEGVENVNQVVGFSFIGGQGSNYGTLFIRMKPFDERDISTKEIAKIVNKKAASIKDAQVMAITPPMIPGYSATSGITFSMQDKTGGTVEKFYQVTLKFLEALNKRPEISYAQTQYNPNFPQYMVNVDVAKCIQSGTTPSEVLSVLQGYYGGMYVSNFNSYGKLYRVMLQASPESRLDVNSLDAIYVRVKGNMAPIKSFVNVERVYGPASINRFNLFTSISVTANAASGYSSGDVLKVISEVSQEVLPAGYGYEYSGLTRSENQSSNTTGLIFILCILFVYLILSAQYESYLLPLSVILSVPFGLAGSFIFSNIFGHDNNIYMQISLIMLIGLLSKNAILIVEFALERRRMGMALKWSAILGASARLRPILMTSLAMIIGLLPLMFASGVGANGNSTLGASAIGGMLIGMILQVLIVPSLFVIFEKLQEKFKPIVFHDIITSGKPSGEVLQYAHPKNEDK